MKKWKLMMTLFLAALVLPFSNVSAAAVEKT